MQLDGLGITMLYNNKPFQVIYRYALITFINNAHAYTYVITMPYQ